VIDPCPVVIDPRPGACDGVRVDMNGACWFWSSRNDSTYDVIFVFTHETKIKPTPEAIGVAFDYNGNRRLDWEWWNFLPTAASDDFFPTYWTNNAHDFRYIEGQAYDDAWTSYLDQFGSARYWGTFAISTGFNVGIGVLSAVAAGAIAGSIGGPVGVAVGGIAGLAIFTVWAIIDYYTHPAEAIVDAICNAIPEKNTIYVGNKNKQANTTWDWTFRVPKVNIIGAEQLDKANPYDSTIMWTKVVGVPSATMTTLYGIDVPVFPDGPTTFRYVLGSEVDSEAITAHDLGLDTMTGAECRLERAWYFREVYMKWLDARLARDSNDTYTCFMPTIDDQGRIGWFAAPAGSITTNFYGTPRIAVPQYDGKGSWATGTGTSAPWLLRAGDVHASPGFKIDIAIVFLAAKYEAAFTKASSGDDQRIFNTNLAMSVVQTVIITLATEGICSAIALANPATAFAKGFGTVSAGRIAVSVGTAAAMAVILTPAVTRGFEALGLNPFTAGQLSNLAIALASIGIRYLVGAVKQYRDKAAVSKEIQSVKGDIDVDFSDADQQRIENMDARKYMALVLQVAAEMDEGYWDTAGKLVVNRMGTFSLRVNDICEKIDQSAMVKEDWTKKGQPFTRIENEAAVKFMIAAIAAEPVHGNSLMGWLAEQDWFREGWGLEKGDPGAVAFSLAIFGRDGRASMEISWNTISRMSLKQFVALAMVSGGFIIGYDPKPEDASDVAAEQARRSAAIVPAYIEREIAAIRAMPMHDTATVARIETLMDHAIVYQPERAGMIANYINGQVPWAARDVNLDLARATHMSLIHDMVISTLRARFSGSPTGMLSQQAIMSAIQESRNSLQSIQLGPVQEFNFLLNHMKLLEIVGEGPQYRLLLPPNDEMYARMQADTAQQLDAVAQQPSNDATLQGAVDEVLAQQAEAPGKIVEIVSEVTNAKVQASMAEQHALDAIRVNLASGMLKGLNVMAILLDMQAVSHVSSLPALPEDAAFDPFFLKKAEDTFTFAKSNPNDLQTKAEITGIASLAEFGYVDRYKLLVELAKGNQLAEDNIKGAILEFQDGKFARWTASKLNAWNARAGSDQVIREGYTALLRQLFRDEDTVQAILAHGQRMLWSVPEGVGKSIDVWLVGQDGDFVRSVGRESKAMIIKAWQNLKVSKIPEILVQAGLAELVNTPVNAFWLVMTNPTVGSAGGFQALDWAGNALVPFGVHKLLNGWHYATDASNKGFLVNPKFSLIETDASGKVVNGHYIMANPVYHTIEGLLSLVPDDSGGYKSLVRYDTATGRFIVQYEVQQYIGGAWNYDGSPVNAKRYASQNGLPVGLTVAQYNMAQALDKTLKATGDMKYDYRVPGNGAASLAMLLQLYITLFAPVHEVSFIFPWYVGISQGTFTTWVNEFLSKLR